MTLYKTVASKNGGTQVAMTAAEETAFLALQNYGAEQATIAAIKTQAKSAIEQSQITVDRIHIAVARGRTTYSATDVVTWLDYHESLRAPVSTGVGPVPQMPLDANGDPAYPAGT